MKNTLLILLFSSMVFSCTHQAKEQPMNADREVVSEKNTADAEYYIDEFGDKLIVYRSENGKNLTVNFKGETFQLKKDFERPAFSTADNVYEFTENRKVVSFTKKNLGMTVFKGKKDLSPTKIAAQ